jgi:hypothetical protein
MTEFFIGDACYDGCRITKGKDILYFGNLAGLKDILKYHFGITDFDYNSTDEKYYESVLPESYKVEITFNTNTEWFRKTVETLADIEVKLNKQRDAYEKITAGLTIQDKFAKLLDANNWQSYLDKLYYTHQDLKADLGAKNQEEFRTAIKNLMVDDLQDTLDAIRGYTCDGVPVDELWEDGND